MDEDTTKENADSESSTATDPGEVTVFEYSSIRYVSGLNVVYCIFTNIQCTKFLMVQIFYFKLLQNAISRAKVKIENEGLFQNCYLASLRRKRLQFNRIGQCRAAHIAQSCQQHSLPKRYNKIQHFKKRPFVGY
jgi:hypothetical protein